MVRATPGLTSLTTAQIYRTDSGSGPRKIHRWLIGAAAVTLWGAVGQRPVIAQEVPKLTIGVVIPLTGPLAPFGKEAKSGVELALETIRNTEPQLAEKFSIIIEDNESVPSKATTAAQKLLHKDHAHILIGGVTATATTAISTLASEAGRPLIAPISAPTGAIGTSPWIFSMALDDRAQGSAAALYALQNQLQTAAAFPDKSPMAVAFTRGFEESFTAGGGTMLTMQAPEQKGDIKIWESLAAANPQVILLPLGADRVARILKHAAERKSAVLHIGGESWEARSMMQSSGSALPAQAVHVSSFAPQTSDVATTEFMNSFRTRFNRRPGNIAAHFHDAVLIAWGGFRRARMNLPAPLAKGLREQTQVQAACGNWKVVPGQPALRTAWIMRPDASEPKLIARLQTLPPQIAPTVPPQIAPTTPPQGAPSSPSQAPTSQAPSIQAPSTPIPAGGGKI
jgi:branched-chain amino acid transport system substrate-binding protein